ncbi:hypothetical protein HDU98_003897 [Podochytrium sp. JEL0797]|nr:hypothetical protein HDU98_003897 [Podochytrium sp. JEL0797]
MDEWPRIHGQLQKLDECLKSSDATSTKINKLHGKIHQTDKFNEKAARKLLDLYQMSNIATFSEKTLLDSLISGLDNILESAPDTVVSSESKPKKRKGAEKSVPGWTAVKKPRAEEEGGSSLLLPGSQVVVHPADDFILANVIRYHAEKQKYEVEDVDDDEGGIRKKYLFSPKQIIPITDNAQREFPEGHLVLALYPGSTCFYKAIVMLPPSKNPARVYSIRFDDDHGENRSVTAKFCLDFPKLRKSG